MKTLSERLKAARKRKGWSQYDLARISGVTRSAIAQAETGLTSTPRQIMELSKALDVSPAWLLFGVEELDSLSEEAIQAAVDLDQLPEQAKRMILAAIDSAKQKD